MYLHRNRSAEAQLAVHALASKRHIRATAHWLFSGHRWCFCRSAPRRPRQQILFPSILFIHAGPLVAKRMSANRLGVALLVVASQRGRGGRGNREWSAAAVANTGDTTTDFGEMYTTTHSFFSTQTPGRKAAASLSSASSSPSPLPTSS